jgi:hypothetical protein
MERHAFMLSDLGQQLEEVKLVLMEEVKVRIKLCGQVLDD